MLPIHVSPEQVRENFARQFTPDGGFYLYRHGQRGAAYRLTAAERAAFVADFNRGLGRVYWSALVAVIAVLLLVEWRADLVPRALGPWSETIGLGVIALVFVVIWWRLWTAPLRVLERRVTVASPLRSPGRWRADIGQLSWMPIVLGTMGCLLIVAIGARGWLLDRSGIDYVIGGGIGVAFFLAIAVIKLRAR